MNTPGKTNKAILFLGDSITYGFPYGPPYSWVNALRGVIPAQPLNGGVNGDTIPDMLRRLPGELKKHAITHLHILGGINDAWLENDHGWVRECIGKMIHICNERSITPLLGLTTPLCVEPNGGNSFFPFGLEKIIKWLEIHREWLSGYAKINSIALIDYFTPLCLPGTGNGNPRYFFDEAHLNTKGNELMAGIAGKSLNNILPGNHID